MSTSIAPNVRDDVPAGLPCANSSSSFWHSEPSPYLLNHRTTEQLPQYADVVIVGSGITGASAARYLAEDARASGLSIVMLDAREVCWGATGRNGGHCQPLLFDRTPEIGAFEMRNVAAVREYIEEHKVDCEWRNVSSCRTFWNKKVFEAAEKEVELLRSADPEMGKLVEVITDKKLLKEHRVQAHAAGATLTKGAASLWPYKYVTFIIEKLVKEGRMNLQTNTPVTSIEPATSASDSTRTLLTPRGSIKAAHVILATNGYTSSLVKDFAPLVVPVRCEMSALHPPKNSMRLEHSYGVVGVGDSNPEWDDYLVQRPFYDSPNGDGTRRGGHLMYGGGRGQAEYNCVGETDDDIVDQGEAAHLRRTLLDVLELGGETKGLRELKASHQWTGIKGYSRDNTPWVGRVPEQSCLWVSAGYTGHGMPNATLCAKAVVDMILGSRNGTPYEAICRNLVEAKELPQSYIVTSRRLQEALSMPSVAIQDSEGFSNEKNGDFLKGAELKTSSSRCSVM